MKARIKGTDSDFKEITGIMVEGNVIYPIDRVEFDSEPKPTHGSIDWEARRFELVKAAMQGVCANNDIILANLANNDKTGKMCIGIADAVLAEYRKGENNERTNDL